MVIAAGLVPIIEPEVDIHAPDKAEAEDMLRAALSCRTSAIAKGATSDAEAYDTLKTLASMTSLRIIRQ